VTQSGERFSGLRKFAALVTLYTIGVILFGAWVRVTGSGAGCGEHWPSCHGEVIPRAPNAKTLIEFTHRLTSGIDGLFILGLAIAVFRLTPIGHRARTWAVRAGVFLIIEALIGAVLVKFGLVADDTSKIRVLVVALHLVNTLLLVGSIAMVGLALAPAPAEAADRRGLRNTLLAGLVYMVICAMGAVTALGDTLFPIIFGASVEHLVPSEASAHFLERARLIHPVVAVVGSLWILHVGAAAAAAPAPTRSAGRLVVAGILLQTVIGVANIWLSAPGWMQLVHLATANFVWLALVWQAACYSAPSGAAEVIPKMRAIGDEIA
jgi:heme A synthase